MRESCIRSAHSLLQLTTTPLTFGFTKLDPTHSDTHLISIQSNYLHMCPITDIRDHYFYHLNRHPVLPRLVQEPKVQPFVPLVRCRPDILILLLRRPAIPNLRPGCIPIDIPSLCQTAQDQITHHDTQQNLVTSVVVWFVTWLVDVRRYDGGSLDVHVVY